MANDEQTPRSAAPFESLPPVQRGEATLGRPVWAVPALVLSLLAVTLIVVAVISRSGGTPSGGTPSGGTPSGGTPSGGITFSPSTFTCTGETRVMQVVIPAGYDASRQVTISITDPDSPVVSGTRTFGDLGTLSADGRTTRASSSDTDVPECILLANGPHRLEIKDAATGVTLAWGDFTVAR
jgi:hypothetical protein